MKDISKLEIEFLTQLGYISGYELKDLIQGFTSTEVLLKPEDLETFNKISEE